MELPARIGRYEVVRMLGQGGMGRVLLARDTVLGRLVAIKILRDDLGLPPELKEALFTRMRNEARAAAALVHPNIVTLHDMGEEDGLGLFLVFEYIDGPTLRERIEQGALPAGQVARMARELGHALAHAHAARVIHRDIKPENVMLARGGAKITDFGIARLPDSTLTRGGSILGTPAYSAPEALAAAEFSPASDQFSLAVTLYEAISGARAFPGEDALAVAARITTDKPRPIVTHGQAVDDVLSQAMRLPVEKRYPSCSAFGDALYRALGGTSEAGDPLPIAETPERKTERKSMRRWQNVLVGLVIVAGFLGFVIDKRGAMPPRGVSLRGVSSAFSRAIGAPAPKPSSSSAAPVSPPLRPVWPKASASGSAAASVPASSASMTPSASASAPLPSASAPSPSAGTPSSHASSPAPPASVTPPR